MPDRIIAYCGLVCSECPSYTATLANDMAALQKVAEDAREQFGVTLTAEECMCEGCFSSGRKIGYCSQCQIRACASTIGIANCAHCADYGCPTLATFLEQAPSAKATLDAIRATLMAG